MSDAALKKATYEDLYRIPANMTGEIIGGRLIVTPRPSRQHAFAESVLVGKLNPAYQFGEGGGPGGWIILIEPEIAIGEDILVPDLAGWREERFPASEEHNWISVEPDWVAEILSPSTVRTDKTDKMPTYAQHGVSHLWLIDPLARTLDVFRLEGGRWVVLGLFAENDKVRAEPFQEMEIDLGNLWLEQRLGRRP